MKLLAYSPLILLSIFVIGGALLMFNTMNRIYSTDELVASLSNEKQYAELVEWADSVFNKNIDSLGELPNNQFEYNLNYSVEAYPDFEAIFPILNALCYEDYEDMHEILLRINLNKTANSHYYISLSAGRRVIVILKEKSMKYPYPLHMVWERERVCIGAYPLD